jgi:hypothetical protein
MICYSVYQIGPSLPSRLFVHEDNCLFRLGHAQVSMKREVEKFLEMTTDIASITGHRE